MHSDQCSYCRKWVCHKPILGTLHFCLSPEERATIDRAKQAAEWQKELTARQERLGPEFEKVLFGNIFDNYAR